DKVGCEYREGHSEFSESSDSLIDVNELENSLPEEDSARHQAEKNRRFRPIDRRLTKPSHDIFHRRLAFFFGRFVLVIHIARLSPLDFIPQPGDLGRRHPNRLASQDDANSIE